MATTVVPTAVTVQEKGAQSKTPKIINNLFTPFKEKEVAGKILLLATSFQIASILFAWWYNSGRLLPAPLEVINAFIRIWSQGFAADLYSSFILNIEALAISTVISLGLSYFTVIPFFKYPVILTSTLRFMGLVGISIAFTVTFGGGHYLKVALLVFGMSVFYVTSMTDVILNISSEQLDHLRTLRMGDWRVWWEGVILDTIPEAFIVMRQNAAIGWMMLTMVEGLSRSEGGVGVALLVQNKFLNLDAIAAVNMSIVLFALAQDGFIYFGLRAFFPYYFLGREQK